jgi:hypothetical protein
LRCARCSFYPSANAFKTHVKMSYRENSKSGNTPNPVVAQQ